MEPLSNRFVPVYTEQSFEETFKRKPRLDPSKPAKPWVVEVDGDPDDIIELQGWNGAKGEVETRKYTVREAATENMGTEITYPPYSVAPTSAKFKFGESLQPVPVDRLSTYEEAVKLRDEIVAHTGASVQISELKVRPHGGWPADEPRRWYNFIINGSGPFNVGLYAASRHGVAGYFAPGTITLTASGEPVFSPSHKTKVTLEPNTFIPFKEPLGPNEYVKTGLMGTPYVFTKDEDTPTNNSIVDLEESYGVLSNQVAMLSVQVEGLISIINSLLTKLDD